MTGRTALEAAELFARWRMMTAEAIETLAGSGALTPLGARFVDGMRATVQPWLDEQVPETAAAAARGWAAERREAWQRAGGRSDAVRPPGHYVTEAVRPPVTRRAARPPTCAGSGFEPGQSCSCTPRSGRSAG